MLIEKENTGKKKSKYICDKCGKQINTDTERRYKISIDTPKDNTSGMKMIRRYDLCKHCTNVIINYVEKKGK